MLIQKLKPSLFNYEIFILTFNDLCVHFKIDYDEYNVYVVKQDINNNDLYNLNQRLISHNFSVESVSCPEFQFNSCFTTTHRIYLRGSDKDADGAPLIRSDYIEQRKIDFEKLMNLFLILSKI